MRRIPFFAPLVVMSLATAAFGQQTSGDLVGTVKDATGAAVPNAQITLTNEAIGVKVNSTASGAGEYRVNNLQAGRYDLVVTTAGFQPSVLKGISVVLGTTSTANVTVNVGSNQTVEVSADAGVVLDTTSTNLSQTFSNQELTQLPTATVGFGVLNASLLSPGVASTGGLGLGEGPSVGGQRPRNNNYVLEGIDNNSKSVTGPLLYVPNDAVGTFTLITNQFSPEFGHSSGGQFIVGIVSGTNQFHGRAYEFFENRDLNAGAGSASTKVGNNTPTRPRFDYNRYGGQLGGPIFKDKLFFFGSFERQTQGQNLSYVLCSPTAGGLTTLSGITGYGFNATNLAQYLKYTPTANITGTGGAGIDASVDAACGNQATGPQFLTVTNPAGTASTNIALGNYQVSAPNFSNFDALTTGMDYTISSTDKIAGRYIYNTQGTQDVAAYLPVFFATEPFKYHLVSLSEFHTFSPNLTNEFRIGFNRFYNVTPTGNFTFPGLDQFPNLTFGDQGAINYGPDGNAPQSTIQNLYQLVDNITYVKGKNTFAVGFDGRKYISPQNFTQRSRGDYQYNTLNVYLQDLAPDAFGERSTGNNVYYGDQTAFYGYGNDTFRATPTLTFNLGLRYEFTSIPYTERLQSLNAIASAGPLTFGSPQPGYKNFAPRVGVEYAPDSKTSIRAGFGLAYDVLFDNLGLLSVPPEFGSTNDVGVNTNVYNANAFLANGGLPPATGTGFKTFASQAAAAVATTGYVPNQVLPYAESYTLTVQRTIGSAYTAEIGYVGTRGIHLPTQDQINVQAPVTAANQLPTFAPGTGTTVATTTTANTLGKLQALPYIVPAYSAAGFTSKITSYQPFSESNYNGLIANLQRRYQNGLQMNVSYTYSKTMDDATAEVFSTVLTPRRQQDSQNIASDYSRSALDRTNRFTAEVVYDWKPFKSHGYLYRNIVGNWTVSPIYTYESPEYATVLSGPTASSSAAINASGQQIYSVQPGTFIASQPNLNHDSSTAIGRTNVNVHGAPDTISSAVPVFSSTLAGLCKAGYTQCAANLVGYTQTNPNAYYQQAGQGQAPNGARNTLPTRPEDNLDLTLLKRLTFFEHYNFEFGAQAFNILNHAQYTPGTVDTINSTAFTSNYNFQTVSTSTIGGTNQSFFNQPQKEFSNNARVLQLSAKILF